MVSWKLGNGLGMENYLSRGQGGREQAAGALEGDGAGARLHIPRVVSIPWSLEPREAA